MNHVKSPDEKAADGVKPEPVCQYDTQERKPRAKVILSITMFAVLMIVVIGGIFWQMAESMSPLIKAGAGWLYMLIMGRCQWRGHLWKRVQYLCQPVQGKG